MSLRDDLLERDWLPDSVLRFFIRRLLAARLREEAAQQRQAAFVAQLRDSPIALHSAAANRQHYEVPTEFFARVLGPRLKYSCAYWPPGVGTLAEAEEAMLALCVERAELRDGQRVLELGCGWGSLTLYLAQRFPASALLAVSNSRSQRAYIEQQAAARGLRNVRVITADMNDFATSETFDRVVSVEMFEHMRNYGALLARIARWLAPQGRLFVHIFAHRRFAYPYEARDASDWMTEHFFTGGTMPSDQLLYHFQDDLQIVDHARLSGTHYQQTAEAWLRNMDGERAAIDEIFAAVYGAAAVTRWRVRWRIFFMACAELFGYGGGQEWQVAHYVLAARGRGR